MLKIRYNSLQDHPKKLSDCVNDNTVSMRDLTVTNTKHKTFIKDELNQQNGELLCVQFCCLDQLKNTLHSQWMLKERRLIVHIVCWCNHGQAMVVTIKWDEIQLLNSIHTLNWEAGSLVNSVTLIINLFVACYHFYVLFPGYSPSSFMVKTMSFNTVDAHLVYTTTIESPYSLDRPVGVLEHSR